jgi:PLP dependent protein
MIVERLNDIEARITAACLRAGRSRSEVTIVAVTKTLPAEPINEAIRAGLTIIGENRVQEYLSKRDALLPHEFHLIGHLQRNKVKNILPFCAMIHSVDSVRLAEEIRMQSREQSREADILLEVNTSGEESKYGLPPARMLEAARSIASMEHVRVRGLMTVGSFVDDPARVRGEFALLRSLREEMCATIPGLDAPHLSMGMTNDFEIAIEEGATIVRLGTALFGPRLNSHYRNHREH